MSYEGSDILFEYFFLTGESISWSSRQFDMGLDVNADSQIHSQVLLRMESVLSGDNDVRISVAVSDESQSSSAFAIQAISISSLQLAVEGNGWTDSGLHLELFAPGVDRGHQLMMAVREEERFTN